MPISLRRFFGDREISLEKERIFNYFYTFLRYRLGMDLDTELLETIAYSRGGALEPALWAFGSWSLYLEEKGEELDEYALRETLIKAIRQQWIPTDFQKSFIEKNRNAFLPIEEIIWRFAAEYLGRDLRNQTICHVQDTRIIFNPDRELTREEEQKISDFKEELNSLIRNIKTIKKHK